jgi:putative transposase
MNRTIKIPLFLNNDQVKVLVETQARYAEVFNHVTAFGYDHNIYNGVDLHKATYSIFSGRDFLPSQLICSARVKATEALTSYRTNQKKRTKQIERQQNLIASGKKIRKPLKPVSCPSAKSTSAIRYDARSFSINFKEHLVSLASTGGRIKLPFKSNPYHAQYINQPHKVCSADLCWSKRNQHFFIHVVLEFSDLPIPESTKTLGVDLGLNNLAVSSDGKFYLKHQVRDRVAKLRGLKARLQSKGTPSAKRHLRAVSGKEQRFRRDVNHCVTKQIVTNAMIKGYDTIALEDLKGIRYQNRDTSKKFRARLNSWPFDQFKQFITYKALARGIGIVVVNPRYTSQKCSRCGHHYKPQRQGNEFTCCACGYQNHADLNAAFNISKNCLPEVHIKETLGDERHVCASRAVVQPAYCDDTAKSARTVLVDHKPTTLVVGS